MCGADLTPAEREKMREGSSPRVRSRRIHELAEASLVRIISACAEQTSRMATCRPWSTDHLRVCGADEFRRTKETERTGSSPRVRSRLPPSQTSRPSMGIISACAEQTHHQAPASKSHRDHLRVCGADIIGVLERHPDEGSSPRVRSRLRIPPGIHGELGIISACAEQTPPATALRLPAADHLRVCGADGVGCQIET